MSFLREGSKGEGSVEWGRLRGNERKIRNYLRFTTVVGRATLTDLGGEKNR